MVRQRCLGFHRQSRGDISVADHDGYVNLLGMSSTQDPPIHGDSHRSKLNITLILAMIIALFGLISSDFRLVILGIGVGAYSWLTTARHYYIYRDALIIVYGRPRWKMIHFNRVSHIELLSLPIGDRLRVQVVSGRPIILAARDSETFRDRLDTALEEFRAAHPEEEKGDDRNQASPPY